MSRPSSPILISDDKKEPAVAPVAAVQGTKDEQVPVAVAEGSNDGDGIETPGWLPDGFEIEGYYERDGTFKVTAYICPVSGLKFTMMREFYTHLFAGVRLASKNEVLRYIDEAELPKCVNGDCDSSSEDNIIAQLEFSINSLPPGWVKETAFRKCSDGIRKDTFYMDPITKKVFHSLKSAEQYFTSGEPVGAHVPIMSVTDMYYFDWCTDMLPCLARRLEMEGTGDQKCEGEGQTSRHGEEDAKGMIYGDVNKEHDEEECMVMMRRMRYNMVMARRRKTMKMHSMVMVRRKRMNKRRSMVFIMGFISMTNLGRKWHKNIFQPSKSSFLILT
ncbi:hypothetical protein C2845_PM16G24350 [Panicum miliaceum]|uniref:MBD domain-containing protein n=1 Tax=Panicum miliaceum TaxID=4540 RepID=A0A3L6PXZ7_PANMI|nr:hypothetical protein C2845_PM16G24350 [Panicum miliaceum]